jgi:hypothetical protein
MFQMFLHAATGGRLQRERRRRHRVAFATSLVILACAIAVAPAAFSGSGRARPWPGQEIRVHVDAPHYAWSVRKAMRAWNATDLGVRFRWEPSGRRADVVIHETEPQRLPASCGGRDCGGWASHVGYRGRPEEIRLERRREPAVDARSVRLAAHELGHVLGLDHVSKKCSLMNADTGDEDCGPLRSGVAGIEPSDVVGAARLYGHRDRPGGPPPPPRD